MADSRLCDARAALGDRALRREKYASGAGKDLLLLALKAVIDDGQRVVDVLEKSKISRSTFMRHKRAVLALRDENPEYSIDAYAPGGAGRPLAVPEETRNLIKKTYRMLRDSGAKMDSETFDEIARNIVRQHTDRELSKRSIQQLLVELHIKCRVVTPKEGPRLVAMSTGCVLPYSMAIAIIQDTKKAGALERVFNMDETSSKIKSVRSRHVRSDSAGASTSIIRPNQAPYTTFAMTVEMSEDVPRRIVHAKKRRRKDGELGDPFVVVNGAKYYGHVRDLLVIHKMENEKVPEDVLLLGASLGVAHSFTISLHASTTGFITAAIYRDYLLDFGKMYQPDDGKYVFLIIDGAPQHRARELDDLIEQLRRQRVIIVLLPPNSTGTLQPCDRLIYGNFNRHFAEALPTALSLHRAAAARPKQSKTTYDSVMPSSRCGAVLYAGVAAAARVSTRVLTHSWAKTHLLPFEPMRLLRSEEGRAGRCSSGVGQVRAAPRHGDPQPHAYEATAP